MFWLCGETDRGSSGRGTQNRQIWIILAHLSGGHTRPSQSRAICRTWSCKLDASSDGQARRGNRGGNSGVSVEMWVCGLLLFLRSRLNYSKLSECIEVSPELGIGTFVIEVARHPRDTPNHHSAPLHQCQPLLIHLNGWGRSIHHIVVWISRGWTQAQLQFHLVRLGCHKSLCFVNRPYYYY